MADERTDSRQEKLSRLFTGINMLEDGESIAVTALSKKVGMHHDTAVQLIDQWDELLKNLKWTIVRDTAGKPRMITRLKAEVDIKDELKKINKNLGDIKEELKEIKKV